MADRVVINDVGPRDGLQNQPRMLSVDERLRLIEAIAAAGVNNIEVGSFVSPKAVPAMAGTDELVGRLPTDDGVHYAALIPNMKGYELARDAGARTVNMVLYASEGMAQKNVKMSLPQAEAVTLRELGVFGSAIRLNMEQSEGWREKRSELLAEYRPKLDELKRELSDHLRRVISDDQG